MPLSGQATRVRLGKLNLTHDIKLMSSRGKFVNRVLFTTKYVNEEANPVGNAGTSGSTSGFPLNFTLNRLTQTVHSLIVRSAQPH